MSGRAYRWPSGRPWEYACGAAMSAGPELSSVATALGELTTRIAELAERLASEAHEDLATALYEVERSTAAAARRLESMVDELR